MKKYTRQDDIRIVTELTGNVAKRHYTGAIIAPDTAGATIQVTYVDSDGKSQSVDPYVTDATNDRDYMYLDLNLPLDEFKVTGASTVILVDPEIREEVTSEEFKPGYSGKLQELITSGENR